MFPSSDLARMRGPAPPAGSAVLRGPAMSLETLLLDVDVPRLCQIVLTVGLLPGVAVPLPAVWDPLFALSPVEELKGTGAEVVGRSLVVHGGWSGPDVAGISAVVARPGTPQQGQPGTPQQGRLGTPQQGQLGTPQQGRLVTPAQQSRPRTPPQQRPISGVTRNFIITVRRGHPLSNPRRHHFREITLSVPYQGRHPNIHTLRHHGLRSKRHTNSSRSSTTSGPPRKLFVFPSGPHLP